MTIGDGELAPPLQLFTPHFRVEECLDQVRICLERGWTGLGFKTVELEEAWSSYTGHRHSHFLNSATAALHLALHTYKLTRGWEDGDEVVSTPLTFVSTNHAILYENLNPVFADVDEYLCMDPDSLLRLIGPRTRAVVFVGMGGSSGQFERIVDICRAYDLILILDAAHMAGTKLHDRDPGLLADVACYSFQAVKNMPTGDSGMICFADAELDALARKLSWLGIDKDTYARSTAGTYAWLYSVDHVGFKYHGNSIMASLGLVSLKYLDSDNEFRRHIAREYSEQLMERNLGVTIPSAPGCVSSSHLFQIRVENRTECIKALHRNQVFPGVHYRLNSEYPMYASREGEHPTATRLAAQVLSLPLHLSMSQNDVERVVNSLDGVAQSPVT